MTQRTDDPRTAEQKRADEDVQRALASGDFPRGTIDERRASIERARRKKQARGKAAALGLGLAELRLSLGLSQQEVSRALGTQRSAVSRVESGSYGGLTIERFLLILSTIRELGLANSTKEPWQETGQTLETTSFYDEAVLTPEEASCD